MIKIKDGEITLDGDAIQLMEEATQIVLEVILALVQNDCLDVEKIPKVIDTLTKELYTQSKPLMEKNNKNTTK
jgi:hypothetical protein